MSGNSKRSKKRVREEENFKQKRIKKIKKNPKTCANSAATNEALIAKEELSNIEKLVSEEELDSENSFSNKEHLNSEELENEEDLKSEDEPKSEESEGEEEEGFEGEEEELSSMEEIDKENDFSYKEQLSSEEELESEEDLKSEDEPKHEEEEESEGEEFEGEEELSNMEETDKENDLSNKEQQSSEEELESEEDIKSEDEPKPEEESEGEEFEDEEELSNMEETDKENDLSNKEQQSSEEELESEEVLESEDDFEREVEFEAEEFESEEELSSEEEELDGKDCKNEEFYKKDAFFCHFNGNIPKDKEPLLEDFANWKPKKVNWPHLGRFYAHLPEIDQTLEKKEKKLLDDDDNIILPKIGVFPDTPSSKAFDAITNGFVHAKLINNIKPKIFSGEQSEIFTILSNYLNFWHTEATHEKWDKIWRVYAIHCLNHILKAQDQTHKNNKIVKKYEKKKELPPRLEDQGFARPRILILQPFRNSAYKLIKMMIKLLGIEVMKKKEFENYYSPPDEVEGDAFKKKPEDFQKIFAGNIDDDFRIGVALSKNVFKLGTPFSKSDIIIASPLCLRRLLEEEKGKKNDEDSNHPKVVDVLSSIEIFIIDQADIIYMQNWESVNYIEDSLNKWPENMKTLNIEMYRIHRWHFERIARYFRQTIVFSSTSSDYIRGVLRRARNVAGSVEIVNDKKGVLSDIKIQADLTMLCIRNNDPNVLEFDATFKFFTKELLPRLRKKNTSHVLIYIPDYCDYVRLNYFFHKDGGASFATINEYMMEENVKVAKVRSLFFEGKRKYLLYTERFHFNRRYKIKGVRHIVFYRPPLYPQFFKEICDLLSEEYQNRREKFDNISYIYLLYHLSDKGKLIDLIGTDKTFEMLKSGKNYHSYLTGI